MLIDKSAQIKLQYKIYSLLIYTLFVVLLIPALVGYIVIKLFIPYNRQINAVYSVNRVIMHIWTPFTGLTLNSINDVQLNKDRPAIVIMNHNNLIDMFLAAKCLKIPSKPLIKAEILKLPILGWLFRMSAIAVKRETKSSRNDAYDKMVEELNSNIPLHIFPEGTRNRTHKALQQFKDGAFRLAKETDAIIYPTVVLNARNLSKASSIYIKPGKAQLYYLAPVDSLAFENAKALKEHCFKIMENAILRHEAIKLN